MSTVDCIIGLFLWVDTKLQHEPKHPQARLYPSEVVTLGLLFALKGLGPRPFYRWLVANYADYFPRLPERTRLFRLLETHADWTNEFLAQPTLLGIADTFGIELRHPLREGRSPMQIGNKGKSNHRWIVGAKLACLVNQYGLVVAWEYGGAGRADNSFGELIEDFADEMVVLVDSGFHAKAGDPPNQKVCERGTHNERMLIEQVFSVLPRVLHLKKVSHRTWEGLRTRLAYTMAVFNTLLEWKGFVLDDDGNVSLSLAQFVV
jgi:hypothetical protein